MAEYVITLRFKETSVPDMELYGRLKAERGRLGVSMPVCVKEMLKGSLESGKAPGGMDMGGCMERIQEIVHGELESQRAELISAFSGMAGAVVSDHTEKPQGEESALPGCSDIFPEGLDIVLEKFM